MSARTILGALAAGAILLAPALSAADSMPRTGLEGRPLVPDRTLANLRGRYLPGNGTIVSFGVELTSSFQTPTTLYQAGANVAVDLHGTPAVSLSTWSSAGAKTNGAPPTAGGSPPHATITVALPASPGNTIDGGLPVGAVNGIAQAIQIAGNGNVVTNRGSINVGGSDLPPLAPPLGAPCGRSCSVSVNGGNVALAITTPQGSVMQSVGPGGVLQSALVSTDDNVVANLMALAVQLVPHGVTVGTHAALFGPVIGH